MNRIKSVGDKRRPPFLFCMTGVEFGVMRSKKDGFGIGIGSFLDIGVGQIQG
jgi:hypothetical protein